MKISMKSKTAIIAMALAITANANASGLFNGGGDDFDLSNNNVNKPVNINKPTFNNKPVNVPIAISKPVSINKPVSNSSAGAISGAHSNAESDATGLGVAGALAKTGDSISEAGANTGPVIVEQDTDYPVSSAYAPGLTTSGEDVCMGSASGGAQGEFLGVSFGKTYTDEHCQMLKSSKNLAALGNMLAANKRMCFVNGKIDVDNAISMLNNPYVWEVEKADGTKTKIGMNIDCWKLKEERDQMVAQAGGGDSDSDTFEVAGDTF